MANPTIPTILDPTSGEKLYGNVLVITFTVPDDLDGDPIAFKVEIDKNNPPNSQSVNYRVFESRFADFRNSGHGTWQLQDSNGDWFQMNSGGVTNYEDIQLNEAVNTLNGTFYRFWTQNLSSYDNARVVLTEAHANNYINENGKYYYKIWVTDDMSFDPVFNQVIFGQAAFKLFNYS